MDIATYLERFNSLLAASMTSAALFLFLNILIICRSHRSLIVDPGTQERKKELYRLLLFGALLSLWRGVGPWLMLPPRILWMIAKGMRRGYLLPAQGEKKL